MANPLQFQSPHIGATGVIQDPGVGGALAQAYSGLPQILLALQEQQRRQAQEQLNAEYMRAHIANLDTDNQFRQAEANRQANQQGVIGSVLGALAQPVTQHPAALLPGGVPLPAFDVNSTEAILSQVGQRRPDVLPEVMKQGKDLIAQRQATADNTKLTRLLRAYTENPDSLPSLFEKVPPALVSTFVERVNSLKPDKGSWQIRETGPDRKLVAFNLDKGLAKDLGMTGPPPAPGVSVFMPGDAERRASAIGGLVDTALGNIGQLRASGYDPLSESVFAKAAGNVPVVGRTIQRAALSPSGRLYYDAVHEIIVNGLYVFSGANSTPSEIQNQANQLTQDFFDDPKTLAQKEQFLMGRGEAIRTMGGRANPGNNPLPKSWKDWATFGKQEEAKDKQYRDEAKRLHP